MIIRHGTLVASTISTVTFPSDVLQLEIINRSGSAEIYYTVDGSAPTVGGNDVPVLPAAICVDKTISPGSGATVIKLISSGTPTYTIKGE